MISAIWSSPNALSVGDVVSALKRWRRKPPACSTIKTIMTNLAAKGCPVRRSTGRANVFFATRSREALEREAVGVVVDSLLRNHSNTLFAHLASELAADPPSIARFEHLLNEQRRDHAELP